MCASDTSSKIYLGRIVKAFGIKGETKFVGSDDFWDDALRSKQLELRKLVDGAVTTKRINIETWRQHGANHVIKLTGSDDRDDAEDAVNGELFIDLDKLDVDLPDRELPFQVVGSTVRTEGGDLVGHVASVMFSAAHPVYVVVGDGRDVMIPAVPEFIVSRDEENKSITIRTIPGLLDP